MHKEGHIGLSLLLYSPLLAFFRSIGADMNQILVTYLLIAGLSSFPDIDIELQKEYGIKHRGPTHTLLFGAILAIVFGFLMSYVFGENGWTIGSIAGFGSTVSHILGDLFTFERFNPLWPFSDIRIGFGFFASRNNTVNDSLLIAGVAAFVFCYEPSILSTIISMFQ